VTLDRPSVPTSTKRFLQLSVFTLALNGCPQLVRGMFAFAATHTAPSPLPVSSGAIRAAPTFRNCTGHFSAATERLPVAGSVIMRQYKGDNRTRFVADETFTVVRVASGSLPKFP
jgi:hypothetical protein